MATCCTARTIPVAVIGLPHIATACTLPLLDLNYVSDHAGLVLQSNARDGALELAWGPKSRVNELPFRIDFATFSAKERRASAQSELVVKAIGKATHVIDLTAGLGRDSMILASSGRHVIMVERNKILYHLLEDGLNRLSQVDPQLVSRITLISGDGASSEIISCPRITNIVQREEVAVYLDPMYDPKSTGRKSKVKKETQILHRLVSYSAEDDTLNEFALLENALHLASNRVVVKRSLKAQFLANTQPGGCLTGTTQRFDLYFSELNKITT